MFKASIPNQITFRIAIIIYKAVGVSLRNSIFIFDGKQNILGKSPCIGQENIFQADRMSRKKSETENLLAH